MAAASSSERQELSSNSKDSRKTRTTGITTEYIYFSDINPPGAVPTSAYAKENVRRAPTTSRQPELTRLAAAGAGEDNGDASNPQWASTQGLHTPKHLKKPSYLSHLSSIEAHQSHPAEYRISGTAAPHSSLSGTRPLSIAQKASLQLSPPADKARGRKDSAKTSVSSDSRHSKLSQNSHSSRSANGVESSPKWVEGAAALNLHDGRPGAIAAASWDNMQREVETLRKVVQELQKTSKKQSKRIEELRVHAASQQQTIQEKDQELTSLGDKCSKYAKHISTVEGAIQCQICMDLPSRPYTLAPCGHVLCLSCLQEWFKTSPGVDDEDEDEEDTGVMHREKTCPCCRTVVKHRPCPAFMVKDVVSTFVQEKPDAQLSSSNDATDDDPWKGIFPNSDDEGQGAQDLEDFSDDDDEDDFIGLSWVLNNRGSIPRSAWNYASDSEDDVFSDDGEDQDEEGEDVEEGSVSEDDDYGLPISYVEPQWEPPTVHVDSHEYGPETDDNALSLLRRGCTWEMVQNFTIHYSHRQGIVVSLRSIDELYISDDEESDSDDETGREALHQIYLGWNIHLDEDDIDGDAYMHGVLVDIKDHPEAWRLIPRYDGHGSMDVKKLVSAGSLEDYYTSDTDTHLYREDHDMDID